METAGDAEALKSQLMAEDNGHLTDLLKAADGDIVPPAAEPELMEEAFECPECNGDVPSDANACPHCGVEFEMEEVFECPMCKSMIDVTVDKCPSCGAEFEEGGGEPEPADISSQIVEQTEPELEKPIEPEPETPAEPVSFAERLKQVKEDPAAPAPKQAEPPKELSFAERMKAMKNGTLEEPKPEAAPVSAPTEKPETAPVSAPTEKPEPATTPAPKPAEEVSTVEGTVEEKPASEGEQSFAERMKAIKQASHAKPTEPVVEKSVQTEKSEPAPTPAPKPAEERPAAPSPAAAPAPVPEPQVTKPAPDPETAKKESYKELPRYIGEVKKLLLLANSMKIDISASKALINQAVTAGKKRDLENAIKLVKEGKAGLERDLRSSMINKLRTLQNVVLLEKKSGKDVSAIETEIDGIKKSMDAGDFNTASESIKKIESQMASTVSSALPQAELEIISKTLEDANVLHVNVDEAKSLFEEAKMAVDLDDNEKASELIKKASENLTRILPGYIASEMRKAKVTLREIKMMNVDITQPVNILKEANNYVRDGDYCEALSSIKDFKDFVSQSEQ